MGATRKERDLLGERDVPADALWGIHTLRALENFPIANRPVHPALIHAYGQVKLACAQTNRRLSAWGDDTEKADAIGRACGEMAAGELDAWIVVDALQGGAGTSTNMNVNEVIANRALQILGRSLADYGRVSPTNDVNLHQSTNDTYPTALRVAAIDRLRALERALVDLQESFQDAEKRFAHVVKVGRTQLQDAVLTTLGREMGAYAEAFNRDRWRVSKCEERLRVVNLGGTAIGTGIAAPRAFIFRATDELREITGFGLARAENLVEATQNADAFVEVSGILKACATNLLKIANDLRLMSSGPAAGLGEITLPPMQAGSSIMPGKINPVIPEAVAVAAMRAIANDAAVTHACAAGNLELNAFLPLVADALLETIDLLTHAAHALATRCVRGIVAREDVCRAHVEGSVACATALVASIGYEAASDIAAAATSRGVSVREIVRERALMTDAEYDALISPESVCRLGAPGGVIP
ncbi:MAG: aspartate ammonia-lyase [Deltaproteobacteria bacterium]|nr:aspartate ammonia-lyase [Deltaproteobacteria bacterium]